MRRWPLRVPPQTVGEGAAVTLTGTGTDAEGESLSYAWSQTGGTPSVALTGADTASASFTAPVQLAEDAALTFALMVTDARGATGTDTVTVTVTAGVQRCTGGRCGCAADGG